MTKQINKPSFYRVQNLKKPDDFRDFMSIKDAREFILEWNLHEDTHRLEFWEPMPHKKSGMIKMGIFVNKAGVPAGAIFQTEGNDYDIQMVMAMTGVSGLGKPKTVPANI